MIPIHAGSPDAALRQGAKANIAPWRGHLKDRRVLLCGNGPTALTDLVNFTRLPRTQQGPPGSTIADWVVVGVNRSPIIHWRARESVLGEVPPFLQLPELTVVADREPLLKLMEVENELVPPLCFVAHGAIQSLEEIRPWWVVYNQTTAKPPLSERRAWAEEGKFNCKWTVIEPALGLLDWMQAKEIVLLGVNCGFRDPAQGRLAPQGENPYYTQDEERIFRESTKLGMIEGIYTTQNQEHMVKQMKFLADVYAESGIKLSHYCEWTRLIGWEKYEGPNA